jgi:hypothetical protein
MRGPGELGKENDSHFWRLEDSVNVLGAALSNKPTPRRIVGRA